MIDWRRQVVRGFSLVLLCLCSSAAATAGRPDGQQTAMVRFEDLAGQVGRAEAWQQLEHSSLATQPASPENAVRENAHSQMPVVHVDSLSLDASATVRSVISSTISNTTYLPLVSAGSPLVERRAIWITRYDWTTLTGAPSPADIDRMVARIAETGFNTIFFQVRAAGDAYYTPGLEPWADRLTAGIPGETLGRDPGWDPLARMLAQAHAAGLEVQAYVNVYPAWLSPASESYGDLWPPASLPPQMFDRFTYGPRYGPHPGVYGLGFDWRQHDVGGRPMALAWGRYLWASPGLDQVQAHVEAVILDIVARYAVDGVHLDLVRYAGPGYSFDPVSNDAAGATKTPARDQWQRDRVTALVRAVRTGVRALRSEEVLVSAAVWPYTTDKWNWGVSEGYSDYYQDARGWLATGAVDALVPMLYGGYADELWRWELLMSDFLAEAGGRPVYPGIGGHYEDAEEILARIRFARAAGAPGHAVFSYSGLTAGAWEALATGPYQVPAQLP